MGEKHRDELIETAVTVGLMAVLQVLHAGNGRPLIIHYNHQYWEVSARRVSKPE